MRTNINKQISKPFGTVDSPQDGNTLSQKKSHNVVAQ